MDKASMTHLCQQQVIDRVMMNQIPHASLISQEMSPKTVTILTEYVMLVMGML